MDVERSPRTHVDSQPLPTDSMVTVPLSETDGSPALDQDHVLPSTPHQPLPAIEIAAEEKRLSSRPNSDEIMKAFGRRSSQDGSISPAIDSPTISLPEEAPPQTPTSGERSRSDSNTSNQSAHVDWAELEKKEEQEPQEEGQDEVRQDEQMLVYRS